METEAREKQDLLHREILEAGYDGDGFAAYLLSRKKEGNDIDNWTLKELQIEIERYKANYSKNEKVKAKDTKFDSFLRYKNEPIKIDERAIEKAIKKELEYINLEDERKANELKHELEKEFEANAKDVITCKIEENMITINDEIIEKDIKQALKEKENKEDFIEKWIQEDKEKKDHNIKERPIAKDSKTKKEDEPLLFEEFLVNKKDSKEEVKARPHEASPGEEVPKREPEPEAMKEKKVKTKVNEGPSIANSQITIAQAMVVGFFVRDVDYTINNPLMNVNVTRNQNDFNTLRNNLCKFYPFCIVPYMPTAYLSCNFNLLTIEARLIEERMKELQSFIDRLRKQPLLSTSLLVKNFFSMTNKRDYLNFVRKFELLPEARQVSEFTTATGQGDIKQDKNLKTNCNKMKDKSDQMLQEFSKISKYNVDLKHHLKAISENLNGLGNSYAVIADISRQIGTPILFEATNQLKRFYQISSEANMHLEAFVQNLQDEVFIEELNELQDLLSRYRDVSVNYAKAKDDLLATKEKLFKEKKLDSWKLNENCEHSINELFTNKKQTFLAMLPKETDELRKMKEISYFSIHEVSKEYKHILERHGEKLKKNSIEMVNACTQDFTRLLSLSEGFEVTFFDN